MNQQAPSGLVLDPPVRAGLELVASRGWFGFTLRDVAADCGLGLAALYQHYPTRIALLSGWLGAIDGVMLQATGAVEEEGARDRLFDTMMRRFDLMVPYRPSLRALRRDLRRDPLAALALVPAVERAMAVVLECAGLASDGTVGNVRRRGLMLIEARVLPAFCNDETSDLAPTMAALDRQLKIAERWVNQLRRIQRWRDPSAADPAAGAVRRE